MRYTPLLVSGVVTALLACSGESNDAAISPEFPMTITLALHGDGTKLTLDRSLKDPTYKADYPVEDIREMVVQVLDTGALEAKCRNQQGETRCGETPFYSKITRECGSARVQVFDVYGVEVSDTTFTSAGGTTTVASFGAGSGSPGGCVDQGFFDAGTAKEGGSDGGRKAADAGTKSDAGKPGGGSGVCDTAAVEKARLDFCAQIDKWLKDRKIDYKIDCSKIDQDVDYKHAKAQPKHKNIACMDIIEDGWEEVQGKFKKCDEDVRDRVMNWKSSSRWELLQRGICRGSPLVLDLDGDGIRLSSLEAGVPFDLFGEGRAVRTAWIGGGDALLVLDRNGNGQVDGAAELFGNATAGSEFADGFRALATLDDNGDGRIDRRDEAFRYLQVWRDSNRDGRSAASELSSLADAGVRALELSAVRSDGPSSWDTNGNQIPLVSAFVRNDGSRGALGDAYFRFRLGE